MQLSVGHTWDGTPLPRPAAALRLYADEATDLLHLTVEAPFYGDPPPPGPPGPCWGLWNHEVVELFLLGDDDRYLEIELSPHGHHLVLVLHGERNPIQRELPLDYAARIIAPGRWLGEARLSRLAFGVGQGEWQDTQWVGDEVTVRFDLLLSPD